MSDGKTCPTCGRYMTEAAGMDRCKCPPSASHADACAMRLSQGRAACDCAPVPNKAATCEYCQGTGHEKTAWGSRRCLHAEAHAVATPAPPPARMVDEEFERLAAHLTQTRAITAGARRARESEAEIVSLRAQLAEKTAECEKAERERDEAVRTASKLLNIELCDGCLMGEAGKHLHLSDEDNERLAECVKVETERAAALAHSRELYEEGLAAARQHKAEIDEARAALLREGVRVGDIEAERDAEAEMSRVARGALDGVARERDAACKEAKALRATLKEIRDFKVNKGTMTNLLARAHGGRGDVAPRRPPRHRGQAMSAFELPPCPAVWDCYGDGAMRCCREDGHEGWHRPEPAVWNGIKKLLAAPLAPEAVDLVTHLNRQRAFSERTFGPGERTAGVIDHIRKELKEVEREPHDLSEWIDVTLLALDGAWRSGHTNEEIAAALVAKQTENEGRRWPDWRTAEPGKAIEHDRAGRPGLPPEPEHE